MSISHLVHTYGYLAVFAIVGLECVGIPVPGETALIAAAVYAGATHRLSPWLIFAAGAAAAVIGGAIGFWIGAKGGYPLLRRHGHRVWLDERRLKVARYVFDQHGAKVVFFGRFVTVLRAYAAFLAGVSKMPARRFLPVNAAGGIVWAGVITLAAYLAGHVVQQTSAAIGWVLAAVAAVILGAAVWVAHRRSRGLVARAEAAYPGPLE